MSKQFQFQPIPLENVDWIDLASTSALARKGYEEGENVYKIPQVAGRFLGVPHNEDEYAEMLYALKNETANSIVLSGNLNKVITNEHRQAIQKMLMIHTEEKGLSINRFIAFLEGERLLPKGSDESYSVHIRQSFRKVLELFASQHEKGLLDADFRRVFTDLVKWQFNHISIWLAENTRPVITWYGDATKSEQYFLLYLLLLGYDVLMFHPEATDIMKQLDHAEVFSKVFRYPKTSPLKPFPETKPVRKGTVAFRASQEIDELLHQDQSMLYKSWQFRDYLSRSITLKTTYDELYIVMRERAFIRPNFEVADETVYVPTIFSKVSGISKNKRHYWDRIHELTEYELASTIRTFPFTKEVKANNHFHYQNALGETGRLNPDKMMAANWWRYRELPSGLQKNIASAISRYCELPKLKPLPHENMYELQLYLFTQSMEISPQLLRMLQQFDYSQSVPRIILFNTDKNGKLSRSDSAELLLMNELGVDVVLFNPTGQNDIEQYVSEDLYDDHWLEDVSFNEEFKEASLLKRVIKKIF